MSLATTLAHAQLRNHFHACAFVTNATEEAAVIDPFFVEGMRRGEKAVYLVVRHGGSITARSEGRDRGASFIVDLPTAARIEPPIERQESPIARLRDGVRVLVVDDNVDVAELLSEALQEEGFETAVAYDGQAALERWRSFTPHAGILDVGMPVLDGYELAKALRAEHGPAPTLIAATGYGHQKDRLRAADAGFDCHLVKPVSVHDLVVLLDQRVAGAMTGAAALRPPSRPD